MNAIIWPFAIGCGGQTIPGNVDAASLDTGHVDTGEACGATTCAAGQLCCAGSDEFCSPTCMDVTTCPVFGRPCKVPDGGATDAPSGDTATSLRWYTSCGYPVCGGPTPDAGADAGATDAGTCAAEGTACATKGDTCGTPTSANCGVVLVCDDHDPKSLGCPISSAKFKDGIAYLAPEEIDRLHDETMSMQLATYSYKPEYAEPGARHLGFIIEDQPAASFAVDRRRDGVDMYGYLSMVVATLQVQEREIAVLREELAATRTGTCR
ncbi:MAG: hypothetical protein ACHREM_21480 [Polyangiales bacterium]